MPRFGESMRAWLRERAKEDYPDRDVRNLARALLTLDGGEPLQDDVDRLRERVLGLKGQVASLERERDLALEAAAKDAEALVERVRECNELRDEVADLAAKREHARAEHEAQLGAPQAALEDERAKNRATWNTYEHGRLYGMAIAAHKAERVMAQETGPRAAGAEAVRDAIFFDDAQARAAVMRWQQAERDCETISALVAERIPCKGTAVERVRMVLAALDMSTTKRGAS
jgi:hypothetical protein